MTVIIWSEPQVFGISERTNANILRIYTHMPKINYPNVTKEKIFSSEWSRAPGLNIKG